MALNNSATFFLLALLLLTSLNPLTHAITSNLVGLTVIGRLCCTSTGNCIVGRGVANVTVLVNCSNTAGAVVTVGQGTTNTDGAFTGSFVNLIGINALIPCTASVQLPLPAATCPELSNISRQLRAVIVPLTTQVVSNVDLVTNVVQTATIGVWLRNIILG